MNKFEEKTKQMKAKYQIPDSKWQEFFEDLGDLLALALQASKPHLARIDEEIIKGTKQMGGRGQIQINVNVYDNKVDYALFSYTTKVKFGE